MTGFRWRVGVLAVLSLVSAVFVETHAVSATSTHPGNHTSVSSMSAPASAVQVPAAAAVAVAPVVFEGVTPARLVDTRSTGRTVDGKYAKLGVRKAGSTTKVTVVGRGGVPTSKVGAVALTVTVSAPTKAGLVEVYACGVARPNALHVAFPVGHTVSNTVVSKLGTAGTICVYTTAAVQVLVDVNGWFPTSGGYTSVNPARLFDSRPTGATVDHKYAKGGARAAGSTTAVPLVGRGGAPVKGAAAALVNVTVTSSSAAGRVTVFACGATPSAAPTVLFRAGQSVANAAVVKVGVGGSVCVYTTARTQLIVDVQGWFTSTSGLTVLRPAHLLDTRPATKTADGKYASIGVRKAGTITTVTIAKRGGVPASGVGAVIVGVSVLAPGGNGSITIYPCGTPRPATISLAFVKTQAVTATVLAKFGNSGTICVYTSATTQLTIDVHGWFPLAPNQPNSNVTIFTAAQAPLTSGGPGTGGAKITVTTPPPVGSIVVTTTPHGPYYGQITAESGHTLTTREVALADVIPVMDVSLTANTTTGTVNVVQGAAAIRNFAVTSQARVQAAASPVKLSCSLDAKASVTAAIDANAGNFVFDVNLNKLGLGLNYARIGYNPYITASITAEATGAASCDETFDLPTINLPTIRFSVYAVPVWITQDLKPAIHFTETATASISRTITATASAWAGVVYQNGKWSRQASMSFNASDTTASDFGLDATAELPITYDALVYGITGLHATITPSLDLAYKPNDNKYLILTGQLDLEITTDITLDLYIYKFHKTFSSAKATLWGPNELWSKSTHPGLTAVTAITAGDNYACALLADTTVRCWGDNGYGQLGDGTTTNSKAPVAVTGLTSVTAITAGFGHTCALLANTTVRCWGTNSSGQLGDATITKSNTPVTVTGLTTVTAITAGALHTCALLTNTTVRCWGDNSWGQLGHGTTTNSKAPVTVTGLNSVSAIAAGYGHTCALLANTTVRCWGDNHHGQLGDGNTNNANTPVTVTGLTTVTAITGGHGHTCALLADTTVRCWGDNGYGELGILYPLNSNTPVTVTGLAGADHITAGFGDTCALLTDTTVRCWGTNVQGQLGDGTNVDSNSPVIVIAVG